MTTPNVPYLHDLVNIRHFMENQRIVRTDHPFPFYKCDHTSRLVQIVTGLEVVTGHVVREDGRYAHTCNYDPERGLYVDLTRDQFGFRFRELTIEPTEGSPFVPKQDSKETVARHDQDKALKKQVDALAREYTRLHKQASQHQARRTSVSDSALAYV